MVWFEQFSELSSDGVRVDLKAASESILVTHINPED